VPREEVAYESYESTGTARPPAGRYPAAESALGEYVRAIKARWLLFALIIVVCVGGAITGLALKTGAYEAHARVLMTPVPSYDRTFLGVQLIRDTGDPTRTAQTAATLLEARDAATLTAALRGWPRSTGRLTAPGASSCAGLSRCTS